MGSTIRSTHFSTANVPAPDRFDAWRDVISVIFDVARLGNPFDVTFAARFEAYQLGSLVVASSRQGDQVYSLSPKRTRTGDVELFQVGYYRDGGYHGNANGRSIEGKAGDVQVLDLVQPMHSVEPASAVVSVFLPREIVQRRIGDPAALHGVDLRGGMGGVLADYLDLLADWLPQMPDDDGEETAKETIDVIACCLRPNARAAREAKSPIRKVALMRARKLIEENMQSPRLTPEFLSGALGVSRRSLYRLFEPFDGVHQYILSRRLNHVRHALNVDGTQRIADLAARYGFTCQETFWRAFKRQFDLTPGDARALAFSYDKYEPAHAKVGFDQMLRRLHA